MRDVEIDTDEANPYECFQCGKIIVAESPPGQCPDCAGEMRNRQIPIE